MFTSLLHLRSAKKVINPLLNLLFPPFCLHCKESSSTLICEGCALYFELIDPQTRCRFCFSENAGCRPCPTCVEKRRWHLRMASALDYLGPVQSLIKKLKIGNMPYLAKTAAAFMFLQFDRLRWERPDLIIPVPRHFWLQGTHHTALLAKELGRHLDVKVCSYVGRGLGEFPREASFYLKQKTAIEGKVLLLVDDVMVTGTTLRHIAETLKEGFPKKLYALTFARSTEVTPQHRE